MYRRDFARKKTRRTPSTCSSRNRARAASWGSPVPHRFLIGCSVPHTRLNNLPRRRPDCKKGARELRAPSGIMREDLSSSRACGSPCFGSENIKGPANASSRREGPDQGGEGPAEREKDRAVEPGGREGPRGSSHNLLFASTDFNTIGNLGIRLS